MSVVAIPSEAENLATEGALKTISTVCDLLGSSRVKTPLSFFSEPAKKTRPFTLFSEKWMVFSTGESLGDVRDENDPTGEKKLSFVGVELRSVCSKCRVISSSSRVGELRADATGVLVALFIRLARVCEKNLPPREVKTSARQQSCAHQISHIPLDSPHPCKESKAPPVASYILIHVRGGPYLISSSSSSSR